LTRSVKKKNVFDRFRLEIFNFLGGLVKTVRKIKVFLKKTLGRKVFQKKFAPILFFLEKSKILDIFDKTKKKPVD
jgi:hypothetical protein